ncbi:hypothetical protein [Kitasatospora kifunensis]|uniref:Uncharacterized protein n=1 Tax=Kitasatospora kifunensis TaxID=58351 RepID=A0A7W7QZ14_KITKI|nr:hypothetical protein [Kitasatospora kifunensis]MBB4922220.1 hypothetical protein [Kitasatospora kifunensis]
MSTSVLDTLVATTQDHTARQLASDITARINDLRESLIDWLDRIWRTSREGFLPDDWLILDALGRLCHDLREELYHQAYDSGRYAAARCIAYHRVPGRNRGAR